MFPSLDHTPFGRLYKLHGASACDAILKLGFDYEPRLPLFDTGRPSDDEQREKVIRGRVISPDAGRFDRKVH